MIPRDFQVTKTTKTGYVLKGKIRPRLPFVRDLPCVIRHDRDPGVGSKVFLKAHPKQIPWMPCRRSGCRWVEVLMSRPINDPVRAAAVTEALANNLPLDQLPSENGREQPRQLPEPALKPAAETLCYVWGGRLLLDIADYVDHSKEGLEQLCYVAGIAHNGSYIPLTFYRVETKRTSVSAQADPVSKLEAFQDMEAHGMMFLGSCHSQPGGAPSATDYDSIERSQKHYPCFGAVFLPSGKVHFYGGQRPVHMTVQHPQVKEIQDGQVFQIERSR